MEFKKIMLSQELEKCKTIENHIRELETVKQTEIIKKLINDWQKLKQQIEFSIIKKKKQNKKRKK